MNKIEPKYLKLSKEDKVDNSIDLKKYFIL